MIRNPKTQHLVFQQPREIKAKKPAAEEALIDLSEQNEGVVEHIDLSKRETLLILSEQG